MRISEKQKKIRRWFQRHGWHTNSTVTGHGAWLWGRIENKYGSYDYYPSFEIDRFGREILDVQLHRRKTGDHGRWEDVGRFTMTFAEVRKLAELIDATADEYKEFRKRHKIPKRIKEEEFVLDFSEPEDDPE